MMFSNKPQLIHEHGSVRIQNFKNVIFSYRNLPRANIIAVSSVTIIYLLTNIGYLTAMTSAELLASNAVAVVSIK